MPGIDTQSDKVHVSELRKAALLVRTLDVDSGDRGSIPGSTTGSLHDLGHVTASLWASVS